MLNFYAILPNAIKRYKERRFDKRKQDKSQKLARLNSIANRGLSYTSYISRENVSEGVTT